jgi:hypothetical protein
MEVMADKVYAQPYKSINLIGGSTIPEEIL